MYHMRRRKSRALRLLEVCLLGVLLGGLGLALKLWFFGEPTPPEDSVIEAPLAVGEPERPSGIYRPDVLSEVIPAVPAVPEGEKAEAVPTAILEKNIAGRWILIDKSHFRLYLAEGSRVLGAWPIALGKNPGDKQRSGDMRTPEGNFSVSQIQNARSWTHDFGDGKGVIQGAYGPWFIRIKCGWRGIGIHGTHDPASIGTLVSEGCIRMRNQDVESLKRQITVGIPVIIEP